MDISKIDFSKAPEGATHYAVGSNGAICWVSVLGGKYIYQEDGRISNSWKVFGDDINLSSLCEIPVSHELEWTVYNNDKPLRELTDEQRGMLFNAWVNGAERQKLYGDRLAVLRDNKEWGCNYVYRIKRKSEREAFCDEALRVFQHSQEQSHTVVAMAEAMYDSGKFKYIDNTQYFGEQI